MMDAMDIQAVESKLNDVTVTAIPMPSHHQTQPHNYSTRHLPAASNKSHHHTSQHHQLGHQQQQHPSHFQPAVPQPAHQQSSFKHQPHHQQQQQYQQQYHSLPSPSSPHVSMVPTSQLSPAITATRVAPSSPAADLSAPISLTVTSVPSPIGSVLGANAAGLTKYAQLLMVLEEMGRDLRPTYSGSRSSTERLKRGLVHARILIRECLQETERSARQN